MVEYRVLSSAMMKDVDTLGFVWDQLSKSIYCCAKGSTLVGPSTVRKIIDNSDLELAERVISDFNIV